MEILTVKNMNFKYPGCENNALTDVSFSINAGDFTVIYGSTGSGKSTILSLLKDESAPKGDINGDISCSCRIGYVCQHPEEQLVTDRVYSELAFSLENAGMSQAEMSKKIAETASYFGIEDWFERETSTLSGGEQQLLNLASAMVTEPDILILDEPASSLDPIAASDFAYALHRLNEELSVTIIVAEHRLDMLLPFCNRLIRLENGKVISEDSPQNIKPDSLLIPSVTKLFFRLKGSGSCPVTVRECRRFIEKLPQKIECRPFSDEYIHSNTGVLEFKNVFFRYDKNSRDILNGLNLTLYENEILCILGGNGSGKSTALKCASGILNPYCGSIRIYNKNIKKYGQNLYDGILSLMPQNIQTVFLKNTVREEFRDSGVDLNNLFYDFSRLLDRHPYDLSGGEQQLTALAKVFASNPKILLMDEPTAGLDEYRKKDLISILHRLKNNGTSILIVTHDVDFAASVGDRCAMFFRGEITAEGTPRNFFSGNSFYTTCISRATRGYADHAVTLEDIII